MKIQTTPFANAGGAKAKLLLSMAIFGTIGIFVRWIPLPSSVIALTRASTGAVFLLLVLLGKRTRIAWTDVRRNLRFLLPCGVFLGANWILLFEAYRYTTVATATLCYYFAPIFVLLASPLILHEKLSGTAIVCILTAVLGMALVSGVVTERQEVRWAGILLGLGAAVLYACIVLLNKRLTNISVYDTTIVQLGISAVTLLAYTLLTGELVGLIVTPKTGVLLLIVGILHTGVAYALYFGAIRALPAHTAALFSYLDPIIAILLSALLLHEPMSIASAAGAVLILGATLFYEIVDRKQQGETVAKAANER